MKNHQNHRKLFFFTFFLIIIGNTLVFYPNETGIKFQQKNMTFSPNNVKSASLPTDYLQTDYCSNPSFEEVSPYGYPEGFNQYSTSTLNDQNLMYSDRVAAGSYSCKISSMGTNVSSGYSYISRSYDIDSVNLSGSLTFEMNYYIESIENARSHVYWQFSNGSRNYYIYEYMYLEPFSYIGTNTSSPQTHNYLYINSTFGIDQWHFLSRNLTALFKDDLGIENAGYSLTYFEITVQSYSTAVEVSQLVVDEIYLENSTNYNFVENSGFESVNTFWYSYKLSPGTITNTQETSTDGIRALNMTAKNTHPTEPSSSYARFGYSFSTSSSSYAITPENPIRLKFNWQYNDSTDGNQNQYAYLRVRLYNSSGYRYLYFFLGVHDDTQAWVNSTTDRSIYIPGFGTRNSWVHTEINLYDYVNEAHFEGTNLRYIDFYVTNSYTQNSFVELLVDEFHIYTDPFADGGFEHTWPSSNTFANWLNSDSTDFINMTDNAVKGNWAANLTSHNGDSNVYLSHYSLSIDVSSEMYLSCYWLLQNIDYSGGSAQLYLDFNNGKSIHYVFGNGTTFNPSNTSDDAYILLPNRNLVGSWENFQRNLYMDLNNSFGEDEWHIDSITIQVQGDGTNKVGLLIDEIRFLEFTPPNILAVNYLNEPFYYSDTHIQIHALDSNSSIENVSLYYRFDGTWNQLAAIENNSLANRYDVIIPQLPYGTHVQYYVDAYDTLGNYQMDDNGGEYYDYTVDDDQIPTIALSAPINNTAVSDSIIFTASAFDVGSGINRVEFYLNDTLIGSDSSAPYSVSWDSRLLINGYYHVSAKAFDHAGNQAETNDLRLIELVNDFENPIISAVIVNNTSPYIGEDILVQLSAFDNVGVLNTTIYYRMDEGSWISSNMTNDHGLYSKVIDGESEFSTLDYYIMCFDMYGQCTNASSALTPFTIQYRVIPDTTNPEIQVEGMPTYLYLFGDTNLFIVTATDSESGIDKVVVILNGTEIELSEGTTSTWEFNWDTTQYENGEYSIIFRAYDNQGNIAEESYTYTIDNPDGFIDKSVNWMDNIIQSYYGPAVGAGGLSVFILSGLIIRSRIKKKKQG